MNLENGNVLQVTEQSFEGFIWITSLVLQPWHSLLR